MSTTQKKHHPTTAASANRPKTYVYDLTGVGGRTPEHHPTAEVTKKVVSKGYTWGLKRPSNPIIEGKNHAPVPQTGRKSVSHIEDYILRGDDHSRISLTSSLEDLKMAGGRNSISHVDQNAAFGGKQGKGASVLAREAEVLQVKVLVADMPGFMQVHAFRCARTTYDSLEKYSSKHMAFNLKKEFDKVYGPAWHCIVGSSFGSFVTHSTGGFLYFSLEKLYILLFKTRVRRAVE